MRWLIILAWLAKSLRACRLWKRTTKRTTNEYLGNFQDCASRAGSQQDALIAYDARHHHRRRRSHRNGRHRPGRIGYDSIADSATRQQHALRHVGFDEHG